MPDSARRSVGVRDHLARRLRPLAVVIGVLISLAPAGTYYVFERHALREAAAIYAETFAERLADIAAENPALWRYSGQKYAELLNGFLVQRDITRIDVLDADGKTVGHYTYAAGPTSRWFEAHAPAASAPIRFNNRALGAVRVQVSQARLSWSTVGFAALFTVAGVGLAFLVYRVPVRAAGTAERKIAELVTTLDRRVKETDTLLEIARATEAAMDADELFQLIASGALRGCRADRSVVLLLDDAGRRVTSAVTVDAADYPGCAGAGLPASVELSAVPFLAETTRARDPLVVADVATDPRVPPEWRQLGGQGALFALPLDDRTRIVGVLILGYARRAPTDDDMRVASALAQQVALALNNVFLIRNLRATVEQLRAKNAELDSFVYSVSHDLKSPLVSLQGLAGILLQDYGARLDAAGRHHVSRIAYNSQHMERLITDVLALSRVGREGRPREPIDLARLVAEVVDQLGDAIRERGVKVVAHNLGTIVGVRTQLEQVFANLIGNAVKYLGESSRPSVEIGSVARNGFIECWVRDTGIGIDPAYHTQIFLPFQRLQDIETVGSGLGLAIAKKIVEGVGGRIWVESTPGEGSTFRFTWPLPPAGDPARGAPVSGGFSLAPPAPITA